MFGYGNKVYSESGGRGTAVMKSTLFYKAMSEFYDLLDVIYFRKYDTSPRRVVNEAIRVLKPNGEIIVNMLRLYKDKSEFGGALNMKIRKVNENKKQYFPLLLLADEQEDMIDRYLEKGTMYVLDDCGVKAECVVTDEGNGILEIKNIAVMPEHQGAGYGRVLIEFLVRKYKGRYFVLQVGTGDSPLAIPFYEKCGFVRSHRIANFFTDNYDNPIYECGVQLIDMVYLKRHL